MPKSTIRSPAPQNKKPRRRSAPTLLIPAAASPPALQPLTGASSWLPMFLDFINNLTIESKETGQTILGQNLWGSQRRALISLAEGMDKGIRDFTYLKARQLGECLDPSTLVLKSDLTWVPIVDLQAGDKIVSVDEYPLASGKGQARKMREGTVEASVPVEREAYRLTFDDGRSVICTATHPWLVQGVGAKGTWWGSIKRKAGDYGNKIKKIKPGVKVRWITKPWGSSTVEDGWFGGMIDGEGSFNIPSVGGGSICVCQRKGPVWDRLVSYAADRGYSYRIESDSTTRDSKFGNDPCPKVVFGRCDEIFRLLGQTRPTRFITNKFWEGRELPGKKSNLGWATVTKIEPLGLRTMIDLQTNIGTYIAEGFVSHNTTLFLGIDLFWLFLHPGINGVLVIDDDSNRDKFRVILRQFANSLPRQMRYPIVDDNRTLMSFNVGGKLSILDFIVAGKRKGSLGASRAYRFAHLTEVGNYGDPVGLENFLQTLSENHPDRLFIKESTANGYNHFHSMCQAAVNDITQQFTFIGWWSRDDQQIPKTDPRYAQVMDDPWTEEELELQQEVAMHYGVAVTDEQLAWYRYRTSSRSFDEGMLHQTQPWTEKQAFVLSGRGFFPLRRVERDLAVVYDGQTYEFEAYRYWLGQDISTTRLERVYNIEDAELRVWEDPVPWGRYVIGCDPAYGRSDWNDSHAITVCRCYSDRLVTVAEYGSESPETFQVTWALAHLASMYEDCYVNLEVSGPGTAIMTELRRMKQILQSAGSAEVIRTKSWETALDGIKWYLYHRPDSLGKGYAYGWKTTLDNKIAIMNEFRDSYVNGLLLIKSSRLLEQMQYIVQEGADIGPGAKGRKHDDYVFSFALAHRAWLEWVRPDMIGSNYTYESSLLDDERRRTAGRPSFVAGLVGQWFDQKRFDRQTATESPWSRERGFK